jgi:hypothetical protein
MKIEELQAQQNSSFSINTEIQLRCKVNRLEKIKAMFITEQKCLLERLITRAQINENNIKSKLFDNFIHLIDHNCIITRLFIKDNIFQIIEAYYEKLFSSDHKKNFIFIYSLFSDVLSRDVHVSENVVGHI